MAQSGSLQAFADKIGKVPTQASAFAGRNPRKGIGRKIAREIEAAFGKPHGWLDQLHDSGTDSTLGQIAQEITDFNQGELAELMAQIDLIKRRKRGELG